MIDCGAKLSALGPQLYRKLLVASEVTRQQQEMVDADSRRIDDRIVPRQPPWPAKFIVAGHRIVNLTKPYVRPIVRGKAGKKTEFGAKISISDDNGFVDVDQISWDNYNEANGPDRTCQAIQGRARVLSSTNLCRFNLYDISQQKVLRRK